MSAMVQAEIPNQIWQQAQNLVQLGVVAPRITGSANLENNFCTSSVVNVLCFCIVFTKNFR